ncbi:zinc finger protein 385B-like isoform X2 [Salvia splendens]|uniref:zinc finger protein 385B-like isoform X2 n=1 Tax=Salvia splendens TaxID=180675 RepID=UPI001C27E669|nr:zinc finger protein 385B-like isoform X2 [Salvia splendens]
MALFKFALLCIDLVGWPAIALVYPLFVSIRAVETGSGYHMRKMVRYWIIFSLFSLFEFAFAKVIEWIPFWSGVRLAVIFCLVMPQFEGACLAYQGLVSSFIDRFDMLTEERRCKRRTFLDVVDKYINENGSEALEKLIASQMTPPEARVENRCLETSLLKKSEQEWTCGLCKMTSVGLSTLNAHLQGSMHKSKLEILKTSLLNAKDTGSSPLVQHTRSFSAAAIKEVQYMQPIEVPKCTYSNTEVKETKPPLKASRAGNPLFKKERIVKSEAKNGSSALQEVQYAQPLKVPEKTYANTEVKETMSPPEASRAVTPPLKQEWRCALCKVKATCEKNLNAHLLGNKHKDKLESLKKRKGKLVVLEISGTFRHWCILCDAKMATDVDLASHIGGKRHASLIDEIET